jgi:hypothetical protein
MLPISLLELPVRVTTSAPFSFNPNKLSVRVTATDIKTGIAQVEYELEDTTLPTDRYVSRSWVDRGVVQVPLAFLSSIAPNGVLNANAVNQFIAGFNLVYTPQ